MPAPDLPPAMTDPADPARAVHAHLAPAMVGEGSLRGGLVVVIDQLRASTTIATALARGAAWVEPALTVDEARQKAGSMPPGGRLLGGERGGERIGGFDLGNSPDEYTRERVAGRGVVMTTTNGTAALRAAVRGGAARVIVGALANRAAVARASAGFGGPVHALCAGTRGALTLDDVLAAGALVDAWIALGRAFAGGDQARLARRLWQQAAAEVGGIGRALRESRGGRNLAHIGLGRDLATCGAVDVLGCVPELDQATGRIVCRCDGCAEPPASNAAARRSNG
ncbi:MAG: 2-phosphosulfolactate phosphatase [Planctomyces sp.]|nr:2-phosphosulfolactate phosphatase [Planctomyces sp.]